MLIELRGGIIVREEAIALGCALEAKGHALRVEGGTLKVTQGSRLSPADRAALAREKAHLIALCGYTAPKDELKVG